MSIYLTYPGTTLILSPWSVIRSVITKYGYTIETLIFLLFLLISSLRASENPTAPCLEALQEICGKIYEFIVLSDIVLQSV